MLPTPVLDALFWVAAVVKAATVVNQCESLHDSGIRLGQLGQVQAVDSDARPVRRSMDAAPVQSEVFAEVRDQFTPVHEA